MPQVIYQTKIVSIGEFAEETLESDMLITFKDGFSSDLADYCFIHQHGELKQPVQVGQLLSIGTTQYEISAVGEVANENLKELGHITIRFNGGSEAELPGSVHVHGKTPEKVFVGDEIIISNKEK